ncbi:hypothetical protein N7510_008380 [Penicillium lagena]|uniref:uncharacterized protein n=1 Tax=Penicillium lagena TaxID=94218 RepID=UPI00253F9295|nr:uncharacterized protein N7510_008380 [Penicillium lagena]KAJ5605599.1 hypothetical protein N7510_008380 [Penicillium lagena]
MGPELLDAVSHSLATNITRGKGPGIPFNKVDSRRSLHDPANLARLQRKSGIFKLLLHLATAKKAASK